MLGTIIVSDFGLLISESVMKTGYSYKYELKVSLDVLSLNPSKK